MCEKMTLGHGELALPEVCVLPPGFPGPVTFCGLRRTETQGQF